MTDTTTTVAASAIWRTAKEAANAAYTLPGVHGCRARFEPDLTPDPPEPWPVSTHTIIRVEAWPAAWSVCGGDCAQVAQLEASLASLPGVVEHGRVCDSAEQRPFAWAVLRQDVGSYCDHIREHWSRGNW